MKIRNIFLFSAVLIFSFTSCEKEEAFTANPEYDVEATGDDPKLPTGGGTGGGGGGVTSTLTVDRVQRATVTYIGATWCPPCGAYGDPNKVYMEQTYKDDVIILNVQSGDAISAAGAFGPLFGRQFQQSVGSTTIPHAYWSGANYAMTHRGFTIDLNYNNTQADGDITAILANSPEIGVAAKATLTDGVVSIESKTEFYTLTPEAYIGVYLLEDSVMAMQKVGTMDSLTSHENVIRAAATTANPLGVESLGQGLAEGDEIVSNFTINVPNTVLDNNHLQVAVVVWESDKPDGISNSIIVDVE